MLERDKTEKLSEGFYQLSDKCQDYLLAILQALAFAENSFRSPQSINCETPVMPTQVDLLHPVLIAISDGNSHKMSDICYDAAIQLNISDQQLEEVYPQNTNKEWAQQKVFAHRVRWARQLLIAAGLASSSKHGYLQITYDGRNLLATGQSIDLKTLRQYPNFLVWENKRKSKRLVGK